MTVAVDREAVYEEVCALVEIDRASIGARNTTYMPYGSCILYAARTAASLRKRGIRAVINAGTCMWPRVRPADDDGKVMTHFGYEWAPKDEMSIRAAELGLLPEMHAWAAIGETRELVDLSTGGLVTQAALFHYDWPGDPPPKYLWCTEAEFPKGVIYRPDMDAIKRSFIAVLQVYGESFLRDITA